MKLDFLNEDPSQQQAGLHVTVLRKSWCADTLTDEKHFRVLRKHVFATGSFAFDSNVLMEWNTIFRLASMTKPITAVGAMILVEECKIRLDDPVDKWLPELKDRKVLRRPLRSRRENGERANSALCFAGSSAED